jgi:hypothetical protein
MNLLIPAARRLAEAIETPVEQPDMILKPGRARDVLGGLDEDLCLQIPM